MGMCALVYLYYCKSKDSCVFHVGSLGYLMAWALKEQQDVVFSRMYLPLFWSASAEEKECHSCRRRQKAPGYKGIAWWLWPPAEQEVGHPGVRKREETLEHTAVWVLSSGFRQSVTCNILHSCSYFLLIVTWKFLGKQAVPDNENTPLPNSLPKWRASLLAE